MLPVKNACCYRSAKGYPFWQGKKDFVLDIMFGAKLCYRVICNWWCRELVWSSIQNLGPCSIHVIVIVHRRFYSFHFLAWSIWCASGDPPGSDELEADPEPEHAQPRHWLRLRLWHLRSDHPFTLAMWNNNKKEDHDFCCRWTACAD